LGCTHHLAKRQMELQFSPVAVTVFRQRFNELDSTRQVRDAFDVGRSPESALACFAPILDRGLDEPGLGV